MRMIAYDTYAALSKADGVDDEDARKAAAETGELYVNVEANKVRLNILISIVVAGFVVVIGLLFQIAMRLPAGVD